MTGRQAEELAAIYLSLRGWEILERNLRDGPREIDLLARAGRWLVVVEVRFRSSQVHGLPEESVHRAKARHLLRAGERCWVDLGRPGPLRFDLVSVRLTPQGLELRHHPHFLLPGRVRRLP